MMKFCGFTGIKIPGSKYFVIMNSSVSGGFHHPVQTIQEPKFLKTYGQWVSCLVKLNTLALIVGKRRKGSSKSSSNESTFSATAMRRIIERLKSQLNQPSMNQHYLAIWCQFNRFVICLNIKPNLWEERTALYVAFLVDEGMQSSIVRSYISAIKRILIDDGYPWEDNKMLLASLTKA